MVNMSYDVKGHTVSISQNPHGGALLVSGCDWREVINSNEVVRAGPNPIRQVSLSGEEIWTKTPGMPAGEHRPCAKAAEDQPPASQEHRPQRTAS